MTDYSDLVYLMGGMIIFSLLSLQTTRLFQLNNRVQMNAEIEYNAISIAQNEIDQIKWIQSESNFNSHISNYPKQVPLAVKSDTLYYTVDITAKDITISGSSVNNKKISIKITNKYLKTNSDSKPGDRFIRLQFVKSFN